MVRTSTKKMEKNSTALFTTFHSPSPTSTTAAKKKRLSVSSTHSPTSTTADVSPNRNLPPAFLPLQSSESSELSYESQQSQQQQEQEEQHRDRVRLQHQVRFFNKVTVRKTLSHHNMSKKEKCNYWLQEDEFVSIKQRNDTMIQQINDDLDDDDDSNNDYQGNSQSSLLSFTKSSVHYGHDHYDDEDEDEDEDCKRGLEYGLKVEAIRKRSARYLALEEVLIKQEEQYLSGSGSFNNDSSQQSDYFIYDDEAIADAYYTISYECQHRAHRIAIQDRKEIEYYIMFSDSDSDNDDDNDSKDPSSDGFAYDDDNDSKDPSSDGFAYDDDDDDDEFD